MKSSIEVFRVVVRWVEIQVESENHPDVPIYSLPAFPGLPRCEIFTPIVGNSISEEPQSHLFSL